ncbi:MAG: CpsB/CapC family capsule biosynthesis tyrosine phosphatase [Lachnospiraceae bacterium]|nr:CpsB/CapC family capsule biosynthesis tyrosine phosphatase [Lachnospiraceae bacterium]
MRDLYDIHCHILPGVDDGAKDMDMALSMIEKEIDAGVETIILTPHFRKEMFEPDMEDIWNAYDELLYETRYKNIRLYLGCEFHANMEMVETLDNDLRPTLADSRYVLTEFAHNSTRAFMKERADALLMSGYRPIIAHIERYRATRKDFDLIEDLIEMGCEVQVNADAIIGRDGLGAQRFCKKLMQEDMLHYVGSDTHNLRGRAPHLGECCEYLKKHMGRLYTSRIMRDNPSKIVEKAR